MSARPKRGTGKNGIGVDASGGPVFDPTANVLDLVEKETKRGDDLRAMVDRLSESETRRINAELGCIKEVAGIRAKNDRQLRKAEAGRLDSIRQVDLGNFTTTVGEIRAAVKALADVTTSTATTLQARVDTTAATLAKQWADQMAEMAKRLAALELAAAQGLGKQAVADPAAERLALLVEALAKAQQTGSGERRGISSMWVFALGAASLVSTLLGIAAVLYAVLKP